MIDRVLETLRERRRRRDRRQALAGLEAELRPVREWHVRVRVAKPLQILSGDRMVTVGGPLERDHVRGLEDLLDSELPGVAVEWNPPASGPEAELRFAIYASGEDHARRHARRRLERLGLQVLVTAADRR